MELEVAPGVLKAPGSHLCLSYEQKVREATMDLIRMQCLPLAEALGSGEKRPRTLDDPLGATPHATMTAKGHFRHLLSSSSSSSSAKRSAAALSNSQSSDVKALTSKVDKLA